MAIEICKRIGCGNEAADRQVYCSRECSPYGHLLLHKEKHGVRGTKHQSESWKKRKKHERLIDQDIPNWLLKWREDCRIK